MISPSYKVREFIEEVKDKDYHEIIALALREVAEAERLCQGGRKGCVREREKGGTRYAADLKGLLFWLYHGTKPMGVEVFGAFMPICECLIARGQFKAEAMNVFQTHG